MEGDDDENESSSSSQQQQRKRPAFRRRPRRKKPRSSDQHTAAAAAAATCVQSGTMLEEEEEEEEYSGMDGEDAKPVASTNSSGSASIDSEDPFAFCLRCKPDDDPSKMQELWWYSPHPNIPLTIEQALIPTLMRWKETERGMLRSQPPFRLHQIRKACQFHGVPLLTALSLRRHLIKANHPDKNMTQLQLGRRQDINQSAALFEQAVKECLQKHNIAVWTESDQKAHINQHNLRPFPPTPDFVLQRPLLVKKYRHENCHSNQHHDHHDRRHQPHRKKHRPPRRPKRIVVEQKVIHWIEVKMFYGASTIDHDGKSAVGCLLQTAKKYVAVHGPGAMLFYNGCGDRLAHELAAENVLAMDCGDLGRNKLSIQAVQEHQRTWCADEKGNILN